MCGILGAIQRQPGEQFFSSQQLDALAHRGPDGEGIFADEHATLGSRRLAIIDLHDRANQPMSWANDRYVIIYNGEIYNYLEIRDELKGEGVAFSTQSDTEVLLAAYQKWGTNCLSYLRGMFAFAIWDRHKKEIFLARDRCGEKPLTYYLDDEVFIFGSEFKAVIPLLPEMPELNPESVDMYLHFQYTPEPFTLLKGVHKLGPAQYALLSVDKWALDVNSYWDLEKIPADASITEDDLRQEIEAAIRMTLRSDVPVAVALSGGIDSGVIAALASKHYPEPMHAFSVGYPGRPSYDERDQAKALANEFGFIFHEVEIQTNKFVDFFEEFVGIMDEPIGDIAAFGHYSVPKAAADHGIKVLLTGIGGDELFWGYDWTRLAARLNQKRGFYAFNALFFKPFLRSSYLARQFHRAARTRKIPNQLREYFRMVIASAESTTPADQLIFMSLSGAPEFTSQIMVGDGWYGPAMADVSNATAFVPTDLKGFRSIEQIPVAIQKLLFETWLTSNSINLGDRVSMAVGVEVRLPLLDVNLIEKVVARRKVHPDHHLGQKEVFRKILRDTLPNEVLERPKSGFVPPVMLWLKGVIAAHCHKLRQGYLVMQGILDGDSVDRLCDLEAPNANPYTVYRLVLLEIWYSIIVNKFDAAKNLRTNIGLSKHLSSKQLNNEQ